MDDVGREEVADGQCGSEEVTDSQRGSEGSVRGKMRDAQLRPVVTPVGGSGALSGEALRICEVLLLSRLRHQ